MIIGVLSDTHGHLHPHVTPIFREAGVERILHGGDVGAFSVIEELSKIALVTTVCGNVDTEGSVAQLPLEVRLEVGGATIYMTHKGRKPHLWYPELPTPRPNVAICGHSHTALLEQYEQTLFLNPGAAGIHSRFNKPLTVAILTVDNGKAGAELVTL